eukprot:scaffold264788_cov31-Tisochrysis_lutea.AAC.1
MTTSRRIGASTPSPSPWPSVQFSLALPAMSDSGPIDFCSVELARCDALYDMLILLCPLDHAKSCSRARPCSPANPRYGLATAAVRAQAGTRTMVTGGQAG